ncbi:chloramphenicol phosphotransferase [bacterium]|nr:MAG: chloramphenicol phosphotransferase [bacterium]
MSVSRGRILLVNGASSAGKTTLCRALQDQADEPHLYLSPDTLLFTPGVLPKWNRFDAAYSWSSSRDRVFAGFFRSLAAFAEAGNGVIADIVLENEDQFAALRSALSACDVLFVGLHCPLEVLQQREIARGDRRVGDAATDFAVVHTFSDYDVECDATQSPEENARFLLATWQERLKINAQGVLQKSGARQ